MLVGDSDVVLASVFAHATLAVHCRPLGLVDDLNGVGRLKVPLLSFLSQPHMGVRGVPRYQKWV